MFIRILFTKIYGSEKENFKSIRIIKEVKKNSLERFKLTFGSPEDVVIGYGDWRSKGITRKGKRTTIRGTEICKLFRRFGYRIFLVDEYRTSKSCSSCAVKGNFGECVNDSSIKVLCPKGKRQLKRKAKKLKHEIELFNQNNPTRKRNFQQEWGEQKDSLEEKAKSTPWGLVKCQTCSTYWNRDFNSAINIYSIITSAINGEGRPSIFERPKTQTKDFENGSSTSQRDQKKNIHLLTEDILVGRERSEVFKRQQSQTNVIKPTDESQRDVDKDCEGDGTPMSPIQQPDVNTLL
ncbi:hypothetical protein P9112_008973 [Eukaryota sp. TZLM1-RC]